MHRNRDAKLSRSERDSGHGASRADEILPEAASPHAAQRIKEEVEIPGSVPAFGESRGPAGKRSGQSRIAKRQFGDWTRFEIRETRNEASWPRTKRSVAFGYPCSRRRSTSARKGSECGRRRLD